MKMYLGSVGRNSTLILGITPDDCGLIPDEDVKRLKEFGDEVTRRFNIPVGSTKGTGKQITLKLSSETTINSIVLCEDISQGERVREYRVEGKVNGKWEKLTSGTCIGHKRIEEIKPIKVTSLKLIVNNCVAEPIISKFSAYSY